MSHKQHDKKRDKPDGKDAPQTELERRLAQRAAQEPEETAEASMDAAVEAKDQPAGQLAEDSVAPDVTESLEAALIEMTAERDELKDQFMRARAEFENYRKRTARDMERVRKTAAEELIRELLPALDNLERALGHVADHEDPFVKGVEMVAKLFAGALDAHGLSPIPAQGEQFDPNVHDALTQQPSEEYPAGTVMQEYERGYRLGDFVLRPAKVVVSSGPPLHVEEAADTADDNNEEPAGNG
jgi:molecular chaperone GrpE